jgi:hypothetical protein
LIAYPMPRRFYMIQVSKELGGCHISTADPLPSTELLLLTNNPQMPPLLCNRDLPRSPRTLASQLVLRRSDLLRSALQTLSMRILRVTYSLVENGFAWKCLVIVLGVCRIVVQIGNAWGAFVTKFRVCFAFFLEFLPRIYHGSHSLTSQLLVTSENHVVTL